MDYLGKILSKKPATGSPGGRVTRLPPLKHVRESALMEAEHRYLKDLMAVAGSDIAESCRIAGLSRSRLYALLGKYRVSRRSPEKGPGKEKL